MATLKNICTFFQNLNEYVYASDIETNELVYLNHKAMDAFGVKNTDEIRGRKCYEVLQGSSIPCGMCTNCQLSTGSFVEWRHYNPVLGRHLLLKDTLVEDAETGRKYRVEIAIDVTSDFTEERRQDAVVKMYQEMEMLANRSMKAAIAAETPDESIHITWSILESSSTVSGPTSSSETKVAATTTPMSGAHRASPRRRTICRTYRRRSVPTGIVTSRTVKRS